MILLCITTILVTVAVCVTVIIYKGMEETSFDDEKRHRELERRITDTELMMNRYKTLSENLARDISNLRKQLSGKY